MTEKGKPPPHFTYTHKGNISEEDRKELVKNLTEQFSGISDTPLMITQDYDDSDWLKIVDGKIGADDILLHYPGQRTHHIYRFKEVWYFIGTTEEVPKKIIDGATHWRTVPQFNPVEIITINQ